MRQHQFFRTIIEATKRLQRLTQGMGNTNGSLHRLTMEDEMFKKMTPQEYLKDRGLGVDQVKQCFNCHDAEIDEAGDVWIATPMTGHWLREHEWETLMKFIEAND